ncbi:protein chibby homolog 1-like isoform X2 [Limulus polyphemus]|nr:protein chibby homolog 1-like isoform X2 [Limulus polyphemus]XP_022258275.1 protein chibby homolog 1-like isoform X2 [Limulus polyphemus]XP_022258276.1 protein chibby homolog 1-like isoform X2 [Limulus polyphemus]XP_022258277.1 protein chibby homolog 1-like isoform X2 [Limulus polyphemus]
MPLFGSKFSPKKTTPRKSPSLSNLTQSLDPGHTQEELGLNYGPIKLRLGNQQAKFENGQWVTEPKNASVSSKEIEELKQENKRLIEENNFLKYKLEIMLDLLTEKTLDFYLQEEEVEQLKTKNFGRSKS